MEFSVINKNDLTRLIVRSLAKANLILVHVAMEVSQLLSTYSIIIHYKSRTTI